MDIEEYIKKEAPDWETEDHDRFYASALRFAYRLYSGINKKALLNQQKWARDCYGQLGATHQNTANCMVIHELLGETDNG